MRRLLIALPLLMLAGCGEEEAKPPPPPMAPAPPTSELQRNINATEVSSAVGYDGEALKQSVQGAVDAQQKHNADSAAAQAAAAGN